jgi:hypothetical protein
MVVSMPVVMFMVVMVMLLLQKVRDRVQKDISEHSSSSKGKHGAASHLQTRTLWCKD